MYRRVDPSLANKEVMVNDRDMVLCQLDIYSNEHTLINVKGLR